MPVFVPYDRQKALAYSEKWALSRNPRYYNFDGIGGDCTNFNSQCLYAGVGVMNTTRDVGWYYFSVNDRAAAWTGVQYLYNFLIRNKGRGPYAKEVPLEQAEVGDIVQLGLNSGQFYHSLFIQEIGAPDDMRRIWIATHTQDANYRPLSTYYIERYRCLHIEGARK